jgi:hypothetical protein
MEGGGGGELGYWDSLSFRPDFPRFRSSASPGHTPV